MRIFDKNYNDNELLAALLSNELSWEKISKVGIFTLEELKKYMKNINWGGYIRDNITSIKLLNENNYILDEILEKKLLILDNGFFTRDKIECYIAKDKDFIEKWCLNGTLNAGTIISHRKYNNCYKFKPTELVKFYKIAKVGDKATLVIGTDSYPYEVIWVNKSGLKIKLRQMKTKKTENYDYYLNQEYEYYSDEDGKEISATMNQLGYYKSDGLRLRIGQARLFQDPCF